MGKILAIVFLIVFAWFAVPRIAQAQWFAPTAYPSYWWGENTFGYSGTSYARGWGWNSLQLSRSSYYPPGYLPPYSYVPGYIPPQQVPIFQPFGSQGWGYYGTAGVYGGLYW